MTVLLVVDMSASGRFGSRQREKRELAAEIAAVMAFSAIKNNDRVGLIIFTDEVEKFVPPKKGKRHVLRVVSEILSFSEKSRRTALDVGLDFLGHVMRRKCVAFLISDFLAPVASYERALRITARRHDLIPVTVSDPLEEALPDVGFIELVDPETGGTVLFDTGGPEAAAFARAARAAAERAQGAVQAAGDGSDRRPHRPRLPARADDVLPGARAEVAALRLRPVRATRRRCWRCWSRAPRWGGRRGRGRGAGGDAGRPRVARRGSRRAHRRRARRSRRGARRRSDPRQRRHRREDGRAGQPAGHLRSRAVFAAGPRRDDRAEPGRRPHPARVRHQGRRLRARRRRAAGDRRHLPRPARRGEVGPHRADRDQDRQPDRQRARAGAEGRGGARVGDGGEPGAALCRRRAAGGGAGRADHVLRGAEAARAARRPARAAAPARPRDRAGAARSPGRLRFPRERRQPPLLLRGVGGDPRLPGRALRLRFAGDDHRRADRGAAGSRGPRPGQLHARARSRAGCRPAIW